MSINFTYEDDEGNEIEHTFPTVKEVCPDCHGEGKHVNRNIDGNGITGEEWAEWDLEDRESYLSGAYDVICENCHGKNVVDEIDEDRFSDKDKEVYEKYCDQMSCEAEDRRYERMESSMCGMGRFEY